MTSRRSSRSASERCGSGRRAVKLAARVKPAYGPTLHDLAQARFGGLPRGARVPLGAAAIALVAVIIALALRGGPGGVSASAGGLRFSFRYADLHRERPAAGEVLSLAAHEGSRLAAQIAIAPLRLPPYAGDVTGIEPLVAANYAQAFAARTPGVTLQTTGPTIVNGTAGYNFTYTRQIAGATYFGRVIFLTPSIGGDRGVIVSLLAQPFLAGIVGPGKSNLAGALYEPGQGGVGVLFQPSGLLSEPLATLRISG